MGRRYRGGHKFRKRGGKNRKQNGDGDSSSSYSYSPLMTETDWMLLEKYLLEYRSTAYDVHHPKQRKNHGGEETLSLGGSIDGQLRTPVEADGE